MLNSSLKICDKEDLNHFQKDAVGMLVEYGGRLAGSQAKTQPPALAISPM